MKLLVPKSIVSYVESFETLPEGVTRDKLLYIADLPGRIRASNHEHSNKHLIPLNARTLQSHLRDYKDNLSWLLNHDILKTDNSYQVGIKSKGYRVADHWDDEYISVDIEHRAYYKEHKKTTGNDLPKYLTKWFKGLQIDSKAAREYADKNLTQLQRLNVLYHIHMIENQDYHFLRDTTGNRFHSVFTNIKSEIRQFLSYDGKALVSCDIKNSQPYFSLSLTTTTLSSPVLPLYDTTNYINDVLSGDYYETFLNEFKKETGIEMTREQAKESMFTVLYSKNEFKSKAKDVFKKMYPGMHDIFQKIKAKEHNKLAIRLQRIESHFVIDVICQKIAKLHQDLPIFTIHDSIITIAGNEQKIIAVIEKELRKAIGAAPKLKIERWSTQDEKPHKRSLQSVIAPKRGKSLSEKKFDQLFGEDSLYKIPTRYERFFKAFALTC